MIRRKTMNNDKEFMEDAWNRERIEKILRFKQLNLYARKGQIVFAGSSLAEQFPINELLQNLEARYIIYNRGIGGDVTSNLLDDIETCILDLCPSKLFINIGSNDIGTLDYKEDNLIANYEKILKQVKYRLPNTQVYLLSYYPVNPHKESHISEEDKFAMFKSRTNNAISSANKRVKQLAEQYDYTYINVLPPLLDQEGNLKSEYTVEGIHMWPDAYQKVLEILLNYFN
jgi:lysophospholipase L1-like esterase